MEVLTWKQLGQIKSKVLIINIDGKPKIEIALIAEKDVPEINPLFKVFAAAKYLIFGRSLDEIK